MSTNQRPHRVIASEIADERWRQMSVEGWTAEHDDEHDEGEMGDAAAYYAYHRPAIDAGNGDGTDDITLGDSLLRLLWPETWHHDWAKKSSKPRRRQLIIAAALIVAEIERLDRASADEGAGREPK
jgi:hypothetical protein